MVNHALDAYGGLHDAVNNAGIGGAQAPAGETDPADWARVITINLNGVLYGVRHRIPAMLKTGAHECAIVKMASIHGPSPPSATAHKRQQRLILGAAADGAMAGRMSADPCK